MNAWGIPEWLEREVRARDKVCVYCGVEMLEKVPQGDSRRSAATWEHIINDARIVTLENIARCCAACNSSKGQNLLEAWLSSSYCTKRGITKETVAEVVRQALQAGGPRQGEQIVMTSGNRELADLSEVLNSKGNSQFWRRHLFVLEEAIVDRDELSRDLFDAPMYFAWLSLKSEYLAISMRHWIYRRSGFRDRKSFDLGYAELLRRVRSQAPPEACAAADFAICVRHLIVHKGFPNPHEVLLKKPTAGTVGPFDAACLQAVAQEVGTPRNFLEVKGRFGYILDWLQTPGDPAAVVKF